VTRAFQSQRVKWNVDKKEREREGVRGIGKDRKVMKKGDT